MEQRNITSYLYKCTKCQLYKNRTQVVVSDGEFAKKIMMVGECPGPEEDKVGKPFVGKAGQLLREVLGSIGVDPQEDVYITNVVKCFPKPNLNPSQEHVEACSPYLFDQIRIYTPKLIVALGKLAATTLTGNKNLSITKEAGKVVTTNISGDRQVLLSVHPSYVLRGYKQTGDYAIELLPILDYY